MLPQTGGSSSKFENYIASEAITSGNIVDVYNDNGTNFARNASSSTPMTINISGTSLGYALPIYTQSDHWKYITFTDMSGVSTGGGTPTITITPYKITSGYVKTTGTPQTFNMPTLPASQSGFTYSTHTSVKLTDNVFCIMVDVFWLHSTTGREQSYALFGIFQINESLTITQLQTYTWDTQWNDTNTGAHYGAMTYVPSAGTLRCALFRARPTVNDCLYRAAAITINQSTWNITAVTATSGNLWGAGGALVSRPDDRYHYSPEPTNDFYFPMATTTVNTLYTVSNIGVLGSTGISLGLPADATYFCTPNCYAVNNFIFIKAYRNNGTTRDYYTKVLSLDGTILHSNSYNVNTSVALTEYGFLYSPKYPTYFLVQYYGATNKTDSIKLIGTNVPLVVNTISSLTPFSGRSDFMDNKFMVYGGIYKYIPEYLREIGIAQNNHVLNDTVKTRLLLEGDIDKSDLSNFIGKLTKSTSGTSQYLTKGISATDRIILKSFYNITY